MKRMAMLFLVGLMGVFFASNVSAAVPDFPVENVETKSLTARANSSPQGDVTTLETSIPVQKLALEFKVGGMMPLMDEMRLVNAQAFRNLNGTCFTNRVIFYIPDDRIAYSAFYPAVPHDDHYDFVGEMPYKPFLVIVSKTSEVSDGSGTVYTEAVVALTDHLDKNRENVSDGIIDEIIIFSETVASVEIFDYHLNCN